MLRLNVARRVAFAAVPRIAPLRHYTKDVPGGASFDRRERSLEDKVVRDHEKALLDDLVAQLAVRPPLPSSLPLPCPASRFFA